MTDWWLDLPPTVQDAGATGLLLLPLAVIAAVVLRGFAPRPLVAALLRRFGWANAAFAGLIAVSVGMGIGLIAQERALRAGMTQAADKFDLVVAAPGSEMTLLLATVFLQPSDVPLLSGDAYARVASHPQVDIAAPLAFGDSFDGAPVIGTIAAFVEHLSGGRIDGRMWRMTDEAVVGAAVPLAIGDSFVPAHGHGPAAESHGGAGIAVVGRMAATGTPWDRAILTPVESVWQVHGLADGHAEGDTHLGPPFVPDHFPGTPAIVIRASELWANYGLRSEFSDGGDTMAFFPGTVLSNLYRIMGDVRQAMSLMTVVTQVLVAASVLLGLLILTRLVQRQVAMLRALGAPDRFVIAVIWSYGTALLAAGTGGGLLLGLGAAEGLSRIVGARTDMVIHARVGWAEIHLACAFLSGTSLLSLLPALATLRRPVARGLRA